MDPSADQVEAVASAVQEYLWLSLRHFSCLIEAWYSHLETQPTPISLPSEAPALFLRIVLLGRLLGYPQATLESLCRLLEQGICHERDSRHLEAIHLQWYETLATWLKAPTREGRFQDLALPLLFQIQGTNTRKEEVALYHRLIAEAQSAIDAYSWQRWRSPGVMPLHPETGWPLAPSLHLLKQLMFPEIHSISGIQKGKCCYGS